MTKACLQELHILKCLSSADHYVYYLQHIFHQSATYILYLNHQKRNILATHIAKLLSQKKHRAKIGGVHLNRVFGDARKIGLLLTPPDDNCESAVNPKKKRKKSNSKVRFRIRLIFGMKNGIEAKSQQRSNGDSDEEKEGEKLNCWVPRSRLFPDRSNNRSEKLIDSSVMEVSTPHYTNDLAEDLHYVSTTKLISSMITSIVGENVSTTTPVSSSFHETLILLKVWALQRGFLRGHDAFTTTTLAVLLVYMYRTKGIGKRMGPIQAFTAFMKFWSETDWLGEDSLSPFTCVATSSCTRAENVLQHKVLKKAAFVIPEEGRNESQTIDYCEQARLYLKDARGNSNGNAPKSLLDSYKLHYTSSSSKFTVCSSHHDGPILMDPTMTINYLGRMSPSFIRESRAEAHAALICIHGHEREKARGGAFRKLFLETNRFWTRYDAYLKIPMMRVTRLASMRGKKSGHRSSGSKGDVHGDSNSVWGGDIDNLGYNESVCRGIVEVLCVAFGDRVTAVRALVCGNGDICDSTSFETADNSAMKCIIDSDQSLNLPIRGTSTNHFYGADLAIRAPDPPTLTSDQQDQYMVVALCIDPNTSRRVVDRGPLAEDIEGSNAFVSLWGEKFVQIRRFQDGAIVRAVVWNTPHSNTSRPESARYLGDDKLMGGIVEKIAQHIISQHFVTVGFSSASSSKQVAFELRNMMSFIDGVSSENASFFCDSLSQHKNVISAFDSLSDFLRRNSATIVDGKGMKVSKLGLPLSIDEVEPLSPCLRYSSLFPPVPHPFLGSVSNVSSGGKVTGVIDGEPILIQIRFHSNSKWPSSLNAMGAAKCAMLIQLAEGIEKMKVEKTISDDMNLFDGPIDNTPTYLQIGYRGYSWRIIVRADQELKMLKGIKNSTDEARRLQNVSSEHWVQC